MVTPQTSSPQARKDPLPETQAWHNYGIARRVSAYWMRSAIFSACGKPVSSISTALAAESLWRYRPPQKNPKKVLDRILVLY